MTTHDRGSLESAETPVTLPAIELPVCTPEGFDGYGTAKPDGEHARGTLRGD